MEASGMMWPVRGDGGTPDSQLLRGNFLAPPTDLISWACGMEATGEIRRTRIAGATPAEKQLLLAAFPA